MRHLYKVSLKGHQTGMTAKNLAIVWAPNLLRSKDLNHKNHNNNNNLKDIALQAVCTEFLIKHCDLLFASHLPTVSIDQSFELGIIEGKHIKYICIMYIMYLDRTITGWMVNDAILECMI